ESHLLVPRLQAGGGARGAHRGAQGPRVLLRHRRQDGEDAPAALEPSVSRSGYTDGECDSTEDFLRMCGWNANVRRCIAGRHGQAFMWELYQALEALPERKLIRGALEDGGAYCSLGAVA